MAVCIQDMHWGLLYILQGLNPQTFEELVTRAHDTELSISNHGNIISLALEERIDFVAFNSTLVKISREGLKEKDNRLDRWQKNDLHCSTFKQKEQKVYPFLGEDVPNMLEQLLQTKVIKLPECK